MAQRQLSTGTYQHQLRTTVYVFLFISFIVFSLEAMSAETASILPKKISRFRVVGIQTGAISDRINSEGHLESMTVGLNRSVKTSDLAKGSKDLKALADGVATFNPQLSADLVSADFYSDFQLRASQVMPCFEYGLTDKLNLGVRVPIVHRSAQANFRADSTNNGAATAKLARNLDPTLAAGLDQLAAKKFDTAFFSNELFYKKGYEAPHDFDDTHVGDIEVGGKYLLHQTDHHVSSLQAGLRLPTGTRKSRTNIFDSGTGNGTWATGAYLFNDFYPTSRWIIGTAVKAIYNLPDHFETAVPKDSADALPSNNPGDGQVQNVSRVSGMEYNGELSTTVKLFHDSVYPWIAYQWAQHGRDSYSGPGNLYYEGLSEGTDTTKHAWEVGAGYSTVPAFVHKQAKIPYSIEGLFNRTFAGRNTTYVSYVRIDLISYF